MQKRILSLVATWFALFPIAAANAQAGLVYAVEDEDSAIYLVGSVHMLRADDYPLPPAMDIAYEASDALIMELDLDDLDPVAFMTLQRETGMAPDGSSLRELMGEEAWAQASESAQQAGVNLRNLSATRPWLASLSIMQLEMFQNGFLPEHGVESHYMTKAIEDGKSIDGLETAEEQLTVFTLMSNERQVDWLLATLAEIDTLTEQLEQMIDVWHRGDGDELYEMLGAEMDAFPQLYARLGDDRNRAWMAPLKRALAEDGKNYMVIVGSLHLLGSSGVVELLRQEGYSVRRL